MCGGVGNELGLDELGEVVDLGGALGADASAFGAQCAGCGVADAVQRSEVVDEEDKREGGATLGGRAAEAEGRAIIEYFLGAGAGAGG